MSKRSDELGEREIVGELSKLFAHGVLRLRQRRHAAGETSAKSAARRLEVSDGTVLCVSTGVNGPESPKPRRTR